MSETHMQYTELKYPILAFFKWEHLPPHLQKISKSFGELAAKMAIGLPEGEETRECLRKLLEAKDCAVRAVI